MSALHLLELEAMVEFAGRRENLVGQVAQIDRLAAAENHRALHHVAQLADISRPCVGDQRLARVARDRVRQLMMRLRRLRGKVFRELHDFARAVAQRRHLQLDHIQPVV